MAVRGTMANLILRTRLLINDTLPSGSGQIFADQDVQDVLDAGRMDLVNIPLDGRPTFTTSTLQYLNYYSPWPDLEDDYVLKQYLSVPVTASSVEPITGHFVFAANTYPPIFMTAKSFDVYRSAADLLQRWAAKWVLLYGVSVDGLSLQRGQATTHLLLLAKQYRLMQRAGSISMSRSDAGYSEHAGNGGPTLAPTALDYMARG